MGDTTECIFCRIANHEIPVDAVYEDERSMAFADQNPQAPTHLLLIPKKHFANVGEVSAELLGHLLHSAANLAGKLLPNGHRVVINTGADGGQTVHHLHLHVLGGRHMGWPPG